MASASNANKSPISLQDIATRAGVTKMTVSRFLNSPENVAAATREKISKIIEESGFIPSRAPAMMAHSQSKAIGLVISSFSNLVFPAVIQGVQDEADENGYNVLIVHTGYHSSEEERQVAALLSYRVDGMILSECEHSALTLKRLQAAGIPICEIMSLPENPIDYAAGLDHRRTSYLATKALIQCGRRHLAYLGVRLDQRTMLRAEGYSAAMEEAGLSPVCFNSTDRSNFTLGRELMREALRQQPELDGVLCTNDDVAVGAMLCLQHLGIRIPEDIGVLGYNGLNIGQATIPMLCSIETPRYEIGRMAVKMIVRDINQEHTDKVIAMPFGLSRGATLKPEEQDAISALFAAAQV